jgi:hypothetical protein
MARRLHAALSTFLSLALVLLSPGLEAPRLFAQAFTRAVPVEGVRVAPVQIGGAPSAVLTPSAAPALAASALAAPSAALPVLTAVAPAAAPALAPAPARAASLPEMAKSLAPHLEAAAKPATSASGSAAAGRGIEDVLTGAKSAGAGDVSAVSGIEGIGAPSLSLGAAASAPDAPKPSVPAADAPAEGKTVASELSYRVHRFLLKTVAALTGAVNSLPAAGPALTDALIARAADKRVVLSDYDDTLAHYNVVLPAEMVEAVRAIRAAGKDFAVISDRGDEKRPNQLAVFDSLESLPVELRAGMYVAANSGGRVYRYDAQGVPVRVFELPALGEDQKAKVAEAVAGTEGYVPAPGSAIPAESWSTYGYALMLKVGSGKEAVVKAAELFQDELSKRGVNVEVSPRFAKDAANPPYINFSIVTKAPAAEYIAKALKAEPKDVLVIGDSQYAPHHPKKASWLTRLGVKLSGREIPATGNQTDRNMEKGVPGALTLSVGTTGDPRAANLWVLGGKGPSVTRRVLMSVASKTRAESKPKNDSADTVLALTAAVTLVAVAGLAYYAMFSAIGEVFRLGEQAIHEHIHEFSEGGALFFGGMLGAYGLRGGMTNPAATYSLALAKAVEIAASRGVSADQVHFVQATASMPAHDARDWSYAFQIPGAAVYVDVKRFMGGEPEARASVFKDVPADSRAALLGQTAFNMGVGRMSPETALSLARKAQPEMSAGVGVSLVYQEEKVSGDKDLWYRFFDDKGAVVSVNGRTGEARVETPVPAKAETEAGPLKRFLIWLGFASLTAGIYAMLYWAMAHAPSAGSSAPYVPNFTAPQGWEGLFGGIIGGAGLGGWLNRKKAPVVDARFPNLKASVSPASPIDGFESYVYAEALSAAKEHAAAIGYRPDNLRLTGASLFPRAWGEDWTFSFVAPREGYDKNARAFDLKVRRTMVNETQLDAFDLQDHGRSPLFVGYHASALPNDVKVSPMDIVKRSGPDARTLELQARWTGKGGEPELWYVLRGDKGREIVSYNAKTGAEHFPDRWQFAKAAAVVALAVGAAFGLFELISYVVSSLEWAPSGVQLPEGWTGPIPDMNHIFGATLGFTAMGGIIRKVRGAKAPKVTDEQIAAAARSVVSSKGGVWSQTEYNMGYYNTLERLKAEGASEAQLKKFQELCDAAPVIGGRFNPWSGD